MHRSRAGGAMQRWMRYMREGEDWAVSQRSCLSAHAAVVVVRVFRLQ